MYQHKNQNDTNIVSVSQRKKEITMPAPSAEQLSSKDFCNFHVDHDFPRFTEPNLYMHDLDNSVRMTHPVCQDRSTMDINRRTGFSGVKQMVKWGQRPKNDKNYKKINDFIKLIPNNNKNGIILKKLKEKGILKENAKSFSWKNLNDYLDKDTGFLEEELDGFYGTKNDEVGYEKYDSIVEETKANEVVEYIPPDKEYMYTKEEVDKAEKVHKLVRMQLGYPINRDLDGGESAGYTIGLKYYNEKHKDSEINKETIGQYNKGNKVALNYLNLCLKNFSKAVFKTEFEELEHKNKILVQGLMAKSLRMGVCDTFGAYTGLLLRENYPDSENSEISVESISGHTFAVMYLQRINQEGEKIGQRIDPWEDDVQKNSYIKHSEDKVNTRMEVPPLSDWNSFLSVFGKTCIKICMLTYMELTEDEKEIMRKRNDLVKKYGIGSEEFRKNTKKPK